MCLISVTGKLHEKNVENFSMLKFYVYLKLFKDRDFEQGCYPYLIVGDIP